jgi:hypothetical protein
MMELKQFEKTYDAVLHDFETKTNSNSERLIASIQNLNRVKLDLDELKSLLTENQNKIQIKFDGFLNDFRKDNNLMLKIHKKMRSKLWYTVIILCVFFFSTAVFSSYHALKAKVKQDEYELAIQEKLNYESDAKRYKAFITRNQKTIDEYNEWVD